MQLVLSPCGTSLLTNRAGEHRGAINKISNETRREDADPSARIIADGVVAAASKALDDATPGTVHGLSAELNAISRLYEGDMNRARADVHVLLCTDTWLGSETARLVHDWLVRHGVKAQVYRQPDLRTVSVSEFQLALSDLTRWCAETLPGYRASGYRVVFNLTGGFKSVNGFLQALAMIHADETVYVFEGEQTLLRLPRLPMRMTEPEHVRMHLPSLRRLGLDLPEDAKGIPETFLLSLDGAVTLSPWGSAVWQEHKRTIYGEQLWPSPCQKLRYGPGFEASVARHAPSPDRRRMVNERIDDLARFLEKKANLARLDFKALAGDPVPPSTHEMDAWADQDAKRMFGHWEEDSVFVLDRLGEALH
jgi:putative CRISPR-associated protein (TIGR02619 family)